MLSNMSFRSFHHHYICTVIRVIVVSTGQIMRSVRGRHNIMIVIRHYIPEYDHVLRRPHYTALVPPTSIST